MFRYFCIITRIFYLNLTGLSFSVDTLSSFYLFSRLRREWKSDREWIASEMKKGEHSGNKRERGNNDADALSDFVKRHLSRGESTFSKLKMNA